MQARLSDEELDQYTEALLSDPEAAITPPDILMSATYLWQGGTLPEIEQLMKKIPRAVVRAKGFLSIGNKVYLLSYVMGQLSIEEWTKPLKEQQHNILVFIYPPLIDSDLEQVLVQGNLVKKGTLMPGGAG